jgi:tetratricopeptide (TPR) repeat protein
MKYDRLGFPIPPTFPDPAADDRMPTTPRADGTPRRTAGRGKRLLLLGLLALVIVPGLLAPGVMPAVSEAVVMWSLERAIVGEARGNVPSAIANLGRAIRWCDGDADRRCRLLCWRAMLRIENLDTRGGLADAEQAIAIAPTSSQPRRARRGSRGPVPGPDAALDDAEAAVTLSGHGDPEALNHRAYIRALVGRNLEQALADIEAALPPDGDGSPEFLDTKGFVLHLLGRHHEAVDLLNVAIDATQKTRRRLVELSSHADPDEIAYQLRSLDHGLAVMHQHRGVACRAMGLEAQAVQDLETAERKGYAPRRGVF